MKTFAHSISRVVAGATVALLGAALISGCSGTSNSLPSAATQPKPATNGPKILGHMNISRSSAATIMAKVKRSAAYATPLHGVRPKSLHTMTSSAGNDLVNNGGPTIPNAANYNILVNAQDESPWGGQISRFENDLFASSMINILDQYIGQSASGQFSNAGDVTVTYDTSQQLSDQDIYNIVYQVAQQYGAGYNNMYHVFLQNGVSQCSQNAGGCYAQQYCAYHGNTDYSDIGHAIYSVEPYQNINGCQAGSSTPNGVAADSTASTLSHETFEAITDPDVPNNVAWYNNNLGEIGDECAPAAGIPAGVVNLNGENWQIQQEYDNNVHDCSYTP